MSIIAREPKSSFTPAPEGLHPAVCCDVVDLGLVDDGFGERHKVEVRWQLELERDEEAGTRHVVRKRYNLSLHEKANLRKDLETWRGRKFTPQELEGFDLEKLLGAPCQVQIAHRITDEGRTWANVQAVVSLGRGMVKPTVSKDYVREALRAKAAGTNGAPIADDGDSTVPF